MLPKNKIKQKNGLIELRKIQNLNTTHDIRGRWGERERRGREREEKRELIYKGGGHT